MGSHTPTSDTEFKVTLNTFGYTVNHGKTTLTLALPLAYHLNTPNLDKPRKSVRRRSLVPCAYLVGEAIVAPRLP